MQRMFHIRSATMAREVAAEFLKVERDADARALKLVVFADKDLTERRRNTRVRWRLVTLNQGIRSKKLESWPASQDVGLRAAQFFRELSDVELVHFVLQRDRKSVV